MGFASRGLALEQGQVDLWFARTNAPELILKRNCFESLLGDEERRQLDELQDPEHRQEYLVSRALLRNALSHYAHLPPEAWRFSSNRFGKPQLTAQASDAAPLQFNVAHTHGLSICAVSSTASVGVDIEHHTDNAGLLAVADDYFSPAEVAELRALPAAEQAAGFFRYWTLKEAFIKAKGEGLSIPLDSFSFSVNGDGLEFHPPVDAAASRENWFFELMCLSDSYTAALAVSQPVSQLRFFEYSPLSESRELADASELFQDLDYSGAYRAGIC